MSHKVKPDNYWKDRVDILMIEKKRWIEDRMALRKQLRELQIDNSSLINKVKQYTNIISQMSSIRESQQLLLTV